MICTNEGCTNEVPPRSRLYCCKACCKEHNHRRSAVNQMPVADPSYKHTGQRICLSCQRAFRSEGAGNRICPKCARTAAHKQGVAPRRIPLGDFPMTRTYETFKRIELRGGSTEPLSPEMFPTDEEQDDE